MKTSAVFPSLLVFLVSVAVHLSGRTHFHGVKIFEQFKGCRDQENLASQALTELENACEECASERARCAYSDRPPPPSEAEQSKYPDPRKAVPFYRAFSPRFADHLYTTSNDWVEEHVRKHDHIRQGIAAYIFLTQEANTEPLYQLYYPAWHDHFYTTSIMERDEFLERGSYGNEGVAGYICLSASSGGKPLYRLWSDAKHDHFYTVSETEKSDAMGRGYQFEGVVGYVYPASVGS